MPSPMNYSIDVKNPFEEAIKGYQTGVALNQQQQQISEAQKAKESAKAMQADLIALSLNKNASAEDFASVITKHPVLAESLKKSWDIMSADRQQSALAQASDVYAALETGNTDIAKGKLEQQKQAALNSGDQSASDKADAMIKMIDLNPDAAKTSARLSLSVIMGPDKFKETFSALSPKGSSYTQLSTDQKKAYGLPADKPFQIDAEGKISQVGSGGPTVSVNVGDQGKFGAIPPGYVLKQENGGDVMAPIPGGPVDIENKQKEQKSKASLELEERSGNVVLSSISTLQKMIDKAPWYQPIAGAKREILPDVLNQAKVDAEKVKQAIVSNIGFDRLQQMRNNSPTGGALGNVTVPELELLQSVLGSISLDQSPAQLKKNLSQLQTIYTSIMKKAAAYPDAESYGFSSNKKEGTGDKGAPIGPVDMNKLNALNKQFGRKLNREEIRALKQAGKL